MKVIWKRPDGFLEATPQDFYVVQVADNAKIWLHKSDSENFPFRISGGWQDEEATIKLNRLVNLLGQGKSAWLNYLVNDYHHSQTANAEAYLADLGAWLHEVQQNLKGDHWELVIMQEVLGEVGKILSSLAPQFKQQAIEAG